MKNPLVVILGAGILLAFLAYSVLFQVNYNEMALVARFGRIIDGSVRNADPARDEAGLYFKWPVIDEVHHFDKRTQLVEDRLEQVLTQDGQSVVVAAYVTWRIENPRAFFTSLQTPEEAEKTIISRLRAAKSVFGAYRLDDLTNIDPAQIKLAQAERDILQRLQAEDPDGEKFGIRYESAGIKRLILPQEVTQSVFNRMKETRQRMAQVARSEGDSAAQTIEAEARSARERILAFAELRAQTIRAEGDAAAAKYYPIFNEDEEFAIFLRKLETYKTIFKHRTTFLIDAKEGIGQEFLKLGTDPRR